MNKATLSLCMIVSMQVLNIHTTLSESKTETLLNHIQVMRELKTRVAQKNDNRDALDNDTHKTFCATDIHQSFLKLNNITRTAWSQFLANHKNFIDTILKSERAHAKDYYVFYHAQRKEFRLIQDFVKEIFEYIRICSNQKAFEFLRFWNELPWTTNANNFIDTQNVTYGHNNWNDHRPDLVKQLLSVNLSLFGNCTRIDWWECSFDYFLNNRSVMLGGLDLSGVLRDIFDYYGFSHTFITPLLELNNLITTQEGLLFQIFIPKNIANQYVYLCEPGGNPYNAKIITPQYYDFYKQRHTQISFILDGYQLQNTLINDLAMGLLAQGAQYNDMYNSVQDTLDSFQARILFSWDMMLNPGSGIKIYRYSTASDESVVEFNKQLKALTQKIFVQWIQDNKHKLVIDSELTKLCDLIEAYS